MRLFDPELLRCSHSYGPVFFKGGGFSGWVKGLEEVSLHILLKAVWGYTSALVEENTSRRRKKKQEGRSAEEFWRSLWETKGDPLKVKRREECSKAYL